MAITIKAAEASTAATAGSNGNRDFGPKAELWMNIGYESSVLDAYGKPVFISIPYGCPLDTQKPNKVSGNNEGFKQTMQAGNELLDKLIAAGFDMKPGSSDLTNLRVQIRRTKVADVPATDENPHLINLADLMKVA